MLGEQRLERREVHLRRIGLDLPEVGMDRRGNQRVGCRADAEVRSALRGHHERWCYLDDELSADYIVPSVFDRTVAPAVARAVADAAVATGVARRQEEVRQ